MESKKQMGSYSSFTSDLFGPKESPPSVSTGSFASIFPPPSMAMGRNSSGSELMGCAQKQSSGNHTWNTKQTIGKRGEGSSSSNSTSSKGRNSIFQENTETCPLSSSLYYGGQEDMYVCSSGTQASGSSNPTFKKDAAAEDDPNGNNSQGASRGNWWQGSLYY